MLFRSVAIGFMISALGRIQVLILPEMIFLSVANILEAMRALLFNLKNPKLDISNFRLRLLMQPCETTDKLKAYVNAPMFPFTHI